MQIIVLPLMFNKRLFFYLFWGFVLATIAGTLSHECGHWVVGRYYGYHPRISYNYTSYNGLDDKEYLRFGAIKSQYTYEIHNNLDFPFKEEYEILKLKIRKQTLLLTTGGPLETIFTGTGGLFLLFFFRRQFDVKKELSFSQWPKRFTQLSKSLKTALKKHCFIPPSQMRQKNNVYIITTIQQNQRSAVLLILFT